MNKYIITETNISTKISVNRFKINSIGKNKNIKTTIKKAMLGIAFFIL